MWGDDMDVNTLQNSGNGYGYLLSSRKQRGFSLIELVSTLAITGIMIVFVPSVSAAFINSNRVTTAVNAIASDMAYARTAAVVRNQNVQLCKSQDGLNCTRVNHWEWGWIIFVDNNKNRQRDSTETILKYQPKLSAINITYRGSGSSNYIRYRADGATGANGTFAFCSDATGQYKKALILFRTGRLRVSKTRARGRAISCSNFRI